MFFIYLTVFIVMVATPFIINDSWWIFTEDETEAVILLFAGIISFGLYRLRDYQVFETIKDKIKLQRSVVRSQKDLSESYSYIGQANRRTDIMYEIFSDLSHLDENADCKEAVRSAMNLLPYTDHFCMRFIDIKRQESYHKVGADARFKHLPDKLFCKEVNSHTYRHKDLLFVYSEVEDKNLRTCVVLPYSEEAENDIDFFKALTAYFTMVHSFHKESCVNNLTNV
ncbi:MAG: hypothetical protein ACKUBY_03470 [Candidatus Moraniibacteriota bacterium]|jgi:hypothetical protein